MPKNEQTIEKIVIHCSDSAWGSATVIKSWHTDPPPKGRGWSDIGYGFVITNGFWTSDMWNEGHNWAFANGIVECGRPFDDDTTIEGDEIGAHCFGWNDRTIGGCLIGKSGKFTKEQLWCLWNVLMHSMLPVFRLTVEDVVGHYELDSKKPNCPGIDMDLFRKWLTNTDTYAEDMKRYYINPKQGGKI